MTIPKLITVEYSLTQNCYHVDDLKKTLETNNRMVMGENDNRFLIIGLFETYEEASLFVDQHRELMKQKGKKALKIV